MDYLPFPFIYLKCVKCNGILEIWKNNDDVYVDVVWILALYIFLHVVIYLVSYVILKNKTKRHDQYNNFLIIHNRTMKINWIKFHSNFYIKPCNLKKIRSFDQLSWISELIKIIHANLHQLQCNTFILG